MQYFENCINSFLLQEEVLMTMMPGFQAWEKSLPKSVGRAGSGKVFQAIVKWFDRRVKEVACKECASGFYPEKESDSSDTYAWQGSVQSRPHQTCSALVSDLVLMFQAKDQG